MAVIGLGLALACQPDPSSGEDGSSSGSGASSIDTADGPGCGDGVHEPGEVCYERVKTDRYGAEIHGVSIVRDGVREDALVLVSQHEQSPDALVELWQIRDGTAVAITEPLLVPDGLGLYFFATVDLQGDAKPEIVARSLTAYTIFSLSGETLAQTGPIESHPQAPYSGGPFLPGDVDGDGVEELLFYSGRLGRLTEDGVEVLAEVPLGGCGTLRAGQVADFDADGREDFVAVGSLDEAGLDCAGTEVYDPEQHRATIVLGTEDPHALAVSHELQPGVVPLDVVAGDYDGDGVVDLAFGGPDGARVFLGLGDGTFGEGSVLELDLGEERQGLRHAADVDGDGVDELVVAMGGTKLHVIDDLLTIPTSSELTTSELVAWSASGDFDRDGVVDFAVVETFDLGLSFLVSEL